MREAGALLFLVATVATAVSLAFAVEAVDVVTPGEPDVARAAATSVLPGRPGLPSPEPAAPFGDPDPTRSPAPDASVSAPATQPSVPGQETGSQLRVAALVNGALAGAAIAALALSQMNRRESLP